VGALEAAHLLPSVLTVPQLHRRLLPRLSGRSNRPHVALTFDDGPDPRSTPAFLDALGELALKATFFLLGAQVEAHPQVAKRIVAEGHEIAVHGWLHRPHLLRAPWMVAADLRYAFVLIREVTGTTPAFWRPPNGIMSGGGLAAARYLGLQPVLWTQDGRDWDARATADTVLTRICAGLTAGGTVLLHDSDVTSAPNSWRAALGALPELAGRCSVNGWELGPLVEHWS
jgi:peptidoglycan/xylan/chitin deacetylase (PgdA/CDA1 family)